MISCWIGGLRGLLGGLCDLSKDNFANLMRGNERKTKIVDQLLAELSCCDVHVIDILPPDAGSSDIWFWLEFQIAFQIGIG